MQLQQLDEIALLRLEAGKANAIGPSFLEKLGKLLDHLEEAAPRAAVLIGYDRFFSAGLALPELVSLDRAAMERFMASFSDTMLRIFRCPIPLVAAINGHAIAGGCVLALQTDCRLMADTPGRIGLNEVQLGLGLPPVVVETLRMQVPPSSLLPIALKGQLVTPEEALELGMIQEVVPAAELEARAIARARELGAIPASAFAQVKLALRRPTIEAVQAAAGQSAAWIDIWFSEPAQTLVRQALDRLTRR